MKEVRIMKENITYYLVWIICLLAGCAPTPKQIEDTTDPIPMYPDYTDIMIPTNIAPLNFLLRNDADAMQVTLKGESKEIQLSKYSSLQAGHTFSSSKISEEKVELQYLHFTFVL